MKTEINVQLFMICMKYLRVEKRAKCKEAKLRVIIFGAIIERRREKKREGEKQEEGLMRVLYRDVKKRGIWIKKI